MGHDKTDDGDREVHTVATVPPPPGEDDVYDAKTQIGSLSEETMAMLRGLKDEQPPSTRAPAEANVEILVVVEDPAAHRKSTPLAPEPGAEAEAAPVFTFPKPPIAPQNLGFEPSRPRTSLDASFEPESYAPVFGVFPSTESEESTAKHARAPRTRGSFVFVVVGVFVAVLLAATVLDRACATGAKAAAPLTH